MVRKLPKPKLAFQQRLQQFHPLEKLRLYN